MKQSGDYYKDIFSMMDQGYILVEVLFDDNDRPYDIYYIEANAAANKMTGVELPGKRISELDPEYGQHWFDTFGRVAKTGVSERHEVSASPLGVYYKFYAFKVGKLDERKIAVVYEDVTDKKHTEEILQNYRNKLKIEVSERTVEPKQSRDQVQSLLDTTLVQMSILKAIRDSKGNIEDFEITLVNKELERQTSRTDLIGKRYLQEYPGIKGTGLFDIITKTIETGEPQQLEYFYSYEGFDQWFFSMFVKLEDGVVASNMDITERKLAEDERLRNFLLLQQSEELANNGSWDYDLTNGMFRWSDGMYRLFDLEKGIEIRPEIYLEYATPDSMKAAEQVVDHIKTGEQEFEETLEISVGGGIKIIHLKATVVKNDKGKAIRVLGVDLDITAIREAERRLLQMEHRRQQEIFQVTLQTQEEERRRISESLHNGLGQLLYGIRLSINYLTYKTATEQPNKYDQHKAYTSQLLTDAIKETRTISHELMPSVLAEFGLYAAINDVCEKLQDSVQFQCMVELGDIKLDHYIELAVFRTVQELMINVVKHAQATNCRVEVTADGKVVNILVRDNGHGMPGLIRNKSGIGLTSIRNKVHMLKGELRIDSTPDKGTTVEARFPLPD